ncbi:alpha/beta fold hydrolase [Microbacterium sp.]|uniref:alpha/beta fold hydrolase n=1 Tax=Microbacterium sp. TaxID=51671 RepID=UPI003C70C38C
MTFPEPDAEGVAVLWHSLLVDDRMWDGVAPHLAATRRLVRISGPGHVGGPPASRHLSLGDCVALALRTLDESDVRGPVDWVGSAWGGHVGILFAATHPERVRSLVVCNAPLRPLAPKERVMMAALRGAFRVVGPLPPIRRVIAEKLLSPASRADPAARAYLDDCLVRADRTGVARAIGAVSLRRPDLEPMLPRIAAPSLWVNADDDEFWTPAQSAAVTAALPGSRTVTVSYTRHLTPFEAPEASAALIGEFWAEANG